MLKINGDSTQNQIRFSNSYPIRVRSLWLRSNTSVCYDSCSKNKSHRRNSIPFCLDCFQSGRISLGDLYEHETTLERPWKWSSCTVSEFILKNQSIWSRSQNTRFHDRWGNTPGCRRPGFTLFTESWERWQTPRERPNKRPYRMVELYSCKERPPSSDDIWRSFPPLRNPTDIDPKN